MISADLAKQALYSRAYDSPPMTCVCGREFAPADGDYTRYAMVVSREDGNTKNMILPVCHDCQPTVERILAGEPLPDLVEATDA